MTVMSDMCHPPQPPVPFNPLSHLFQTHTKIFHGFSPLLALAMPATISGQITGLILPYFTIFIYFSGQIFAGTISFNFQSLSLNTLKLLGDAHLVNTSIMLTRDLAEFCTKIRSDLNKYVNEFMFVGFTGSTQGSTEVHSVEWWTFTSSFDDTPPHPPPTNTTLTNPAADSVTPPPSVAPTESNPPPVHRSTPKMSKCNNQLCKEGAGAVVGVVTAGAFILALCMIFLIWVYSKKFKRSKKPQPFASEIIKTPKEFSYKELKLATKCFDPTRVIGHGAFGTVFRGVISDSGEIVAVKRCSHTGGQGMEEFLSELSIIGTLRHRNLVRLQEVATGRRPIEREVAGAGKPRENSNLVEWVWGLHKEERLLAAVDPRLCGEFDEVEVRKVLLIGLVCSHPDPTVRPTMRTVVQMLVGEADVPVVSRAKPTISYSTSHLLLNLQDSVSDLNGLVTISTSSSEHSYNGGGHHQLQNLLRSGKSDQWRWTTIVGNDQRFRATRERIARRLQEESQKASRGGLSKNVDRPTFQIGDRHDMEVNSC
ncbi:hypothetical protein L1987_86750 [Smallanthus sonchifolius]|uniref:Uncharacterized protein n=1 Tax=Smallanthus sonchifolius TaxID=185202 RepID=A0ACB8Y0P6_9ASTR|nr:hypothetical protein L1987_86750 [Smallanthus sonchifolius]